MPHPRNPLAYPTEYVRILEAAMVKDITIPFENEKKARSFQMRFGGFRAAIQRDAEIHPNLALGSFGVEIKRRDNVIIVGPKKCEQEVLSALNQL